MVEHGEEAHMVDTREEVVDNFHSHVELDGEQVDMDMEDNNAASILAEVVELLQMDQEGHY